MALLDVLDISGSALAASSVRINAAASNIANAESVSSNFEDTYRARRTVVAAAPVGNAPTGDAGPGLPGVQVLGLLESDAPLQRRYQPDHPWADEEGFVAYPNVNVLEEMADVMSASRSFQLNVEIMNSARRMAQQVLDMGR